MCVKLDAVRMIRAIIIGASNPVASVISVTPNLVPVVK